MVISRLGKLAGGNIYYPDPTLVLGTQGCGKVGADDDDDADADADADDDAAADDDDDVIVVVVLMIVIIMLITNTILIFSLSLSLSLSPGTKKPPASVAPTAPLPASGGRTKGGGGTATPGTPRRSASKRR